MKTRKIVMLIVALGLLGILPGIFGNDVPPKDKKEENKKAKKITVLTAKRLLCDPTPEKNEHTLDNIVNALEKFRGLEHTHYLPDWFQKTTIDKIIGVQGDLEACRAELESSHEENGSPPNAEGEKRLRRIGIVLDGFTVLMEFVERKDFLLKRLKEARAVVKRIKRLPFKRNEWPPADMCGVSETQWQLLKRIRELKIKTSGYKNTVRGLFTAIKVLEREKSNICQLVFRVSNIKPGNSDRRFGYYSWTQTRKSADEIIRLAEERLMQKCR
ncbi:MAG: hypothetical protein GY765_22660 [bacterium]|nr:hypothetical protein [bacterium]